MLQQNGLGWTSRSPPLARPIAQLKVDWAILDGDLAPLEANGIAAFAHLQHALW
jgi:ATP-dependent DNA ligase